MKGGTRVGRIGPRDRKEGPTDQLMLRGEAPGRVL